MAVGKTINKKTIVNLAARRGQMYANSDHKVVNCDLTRTAMVNILNSSR